MKKSVVSLLLLAAATPAWPADSAAPPQDKLAACAAIQDSAQRLACFDQQMAPAPGKPEVKVAEPGAVAAPSFGDEDLHKKSQGASDAAQALHARITQLKPAGSGYYLVYLDNGQAWRHEDSVQGAFLREGEAVTITRGALGSYRLTRDEGASRNWIRVNRVK